VDSRETVEIVYRWPSGREEVRYRRPLGSEEARILMNEVDEMKARLDSMGEECLYSYRFTR
jgi:hypothetical protein